MKTYYMECHRMSRDVMKCDISYTLAIFIHNQLHTVTMVINSHSITLPDIWSNLITFNSIAWHFMTSCDIQIHHAIIENPDVEEEFGKMIERICIFPQLVNMQIFTTIFPCTSSPSRFSMIVCIDNKHVTWCHEMSWGHVTSCGAKHLQ